MRICQVFGKSIHPEYKIAGGGLSDADTEEKIVKKIAQLAAFFLFLLALLLGSGELAAAPDTLRLMVMGEDAAERSVLRNDPGFRDVLDAFSATLVTAGFDVYDETAITLNTHKQDNIRRRDEELIDIAKDAGSDVLVLFTIQWRLKNKSFGKIMNVSVKGRLLDTHSGRLLGNFQMDSRRGQMIAGICGMQCLADKASKLATRLADRVGLEVKTHLADALNRRNNGPIEYEMVFENFSSDEMAAMEEYLVIFSGYLSHRPITTGTNIATHHEYWYRSSIAAAKLNLNLNKAMKKLAFQGQVHVSGLRYTIRKIALRHQRPSVSDNEW